jgi:hypothetical protein
MLFVTLRHRLNIDWVSPKSLLVFPMVSEPQGLSIIFPICREFPILLLLIDHSHKQICKKKHRSLFYTTSKTIPVFLLA